MYVVFTYITGHGQSTSIGAFTRNNEDNPMTYNLGGISRYYCLRLALQLRAGLHDYTKKYLDFRIIVTISQ